MSTPTAPTHPQRLALAAAIGLLASACGGSEAPTGVLLISIDSLRADHVSSYGYVSATNPDQKTTPFIDGLMADGARFTKAYSTTSWTLPAHMALLTGQPNEIHGVVDAPWQLHEEQPYIAQSFAEAGWTTFGIWSGPNLHPYFGFDRSFEFFVDCSNVQSDVNAFSSANPTGLASTHDQSHAAVTGPKIVDTFLDWFDGLDEGEKFFAFVHMWDVHYDYNAPKAFDVFSPELVGSWVEKEPFRDLTGISQGLETGLPRRDVMRLMAQYDAEILYTDSNVEKMVKRLEEDERLDSTLIVVLSDHGEEFGEHGYFGHKYNLYEETVQIPLMMRLPGTIPAGAEVRGVTSIVDVAPTILDIADVPGAEKMWGRSSLPVFQDGAELRERAAPMELTVRNEELYRAARGADWKVIRVAAAMRERLVGHGRSDPRKFHEIEQFVDRYQPLVNGALYSLPRNKTEAMPFAPILAADLPQATRELEHLRSIAVDASHPKVRVARDLWDEVDLLSRQWKDRRKQGKMSQSLMDMLKAAGYTDMGAAGDAAAGGSETDSSSETAPEDADPAGTAPATNEGADSNGAATNGAAQTSGASGGDALPSEAPTESGRRPR